MTDALLRSATSPGNAQVPHEAVTCNNYLLGTPFFCVQRVTKKIDLPTPAVEDVQGYGADRQQPYVPPPGYVRSSTKPFGDDSAGISYTADAADRVSPPRPATAPALRSAPPRD